MRAVILVTFVHCCVPSTLNIAQHMVGLVLAGELVLSPAPHGKLGPVLPKHFSVKRSHTSPFFLKS